MKNVIVFTNERGGVSVCVPTGEMSIEAVLGKDVPAGANAYIVREDSLPEEGDFFNAWELSNGAVSVSLSKAKEITKDRLRAERAPLLAAQDVAFQRALETGGDTAAIVAEKTRLRNVTALADACSTLADLRNLHA
jgi:hypothetical protein